MTRPGRLVELSHTIRAGMTTFKGLPGPVVCDFLSRHDSRASYDGGTEFQIDRIDLVGNTGTYLDTPFHRFAHGTDLEATTLEQLVDLPGVLVSVPHRERIEITERDLNGVDLAGRAVLVHTGWSEHFGTERYLTGHPFLTEGAAQALLRGGAALVGIDSHNIDDTRTRNSRPVHTTLLGAGVLIVEHLTGLRALVGSTFSFTAAPPKFSGVGTFPVRAWARRGDD
jgi:kynurenine formamidase